MNSHDLIERIVAATDIFKKDAKTALETVFAVLTKTDVKSNDAQPFLDLANSLCTTR